MTRVFSIAALILASAFRADAGWAFVNSNANAVSGSSATITVALTGVTAGNIIVIWGACVDASTTIAASDGTSSFTASPSGVISHGGNTITGGLLYLLSSVASGSVTYTVTFGSARINREVIVMEFSGDAGETRSTDGSNEASGTSNSGASGTITTTGTDVLVVGAQTAVSFPPGSEQIDAVNAAGLHATATTSSLWYRILSSTMTGGEATASMALSNDWVSQILAIKSVPSAATMIRRPPVVFQ